MLRITRQESPSETTLQLEGRLTSGELMALDEAWRACVSTERRVVIDLAGVRFVDAAGACTITYNSNTLADGWSPTINRLGTFEYRSLTQLQGGAPASFIRTLLPRSRACCASTLRT